MIRINLLPGARRDVGGGGAGGGTQLWVVAYFAAALVTVLVLVLVYLGYDATLREEVAQNNSIQGEIEELQSESANIDEVRAQLEESRSLEAVVAELQRARFGPTEVLMELTRVLSAGGGPSVDDAVLEELRRQSPDIGVNSGWDYRRLWLVHFEEEDRRATIRGLAKTNEDVAEFLRRLTLSRYFTNVVLVRTEGVQSRDFDVTLIGFELNCQVVY